MREYSEAAETMVEGVDEQSAHGELDEVNDDDYDLEGTDDDDDDEEFEGMELIEEDDDDDDDDDDDESYEDESGELLLDPLSIFKKVKKLNRRRRRRSRPRVRSVPRGRGVRAGRVTRTGKVRLPTSVVKLSDYNRTIAKLIKNDKVNARAVRVASSRASRDLRTEQIVRARSDKALRKSIKNAQLVAALALVAPVLTQLARGLNGKQ